MNKLELHINGAGKNSFLRNIPQTVRNYALAAGQPVKVVPPEGVAVVFFSSTADYWIKANGTAAIASNDSELNPIGYQMGTEYLSIVSEEDAKMSIAFYS
mgnify:CR=1 FL=1